MLILAKFLFGLNKKLYNWPSHLIILFAWSYSLITHLDPKVTLWLKIGLIIYGLLMAFRITKEGLPPMPNTSKLWLGYLVGLNISVVFGPMSILLFLFLIALDKSYPKK